VFALVERHHRDAPEAVGVMLEGGDVIPSHIIEGVLEVITSEHLKQDEHHVDLGFLETKAANAPAFDPLICFRGRVLIFGLQL
jgi:hypothetical protein